MKIFLSSYHIDIPPGKKDYVLEDSYVLPVDVAVLAVLPHAHLLCKEMEGYAILPDGRRQSLLLIKKWDFNWQGDYRYAKPISLPQGTKLMMRYLYDNSGDNVANPNQPVRRVQYGLQSSDEMGELWFQVLARNARDLAVLSRDIEARIIKDTLAYNEYLLRNYPDDAKAHSNLGKALYFFQRNSEAWEHFQNALRLQSDMDEPHYYLGLMLRRANRIPDAIAEFQQVLRLNPDHAKAHGNLGLIYFQEGNLNAAQTHLQSALRINPQDDLARQALDKIAAAGRR